MPTGIVTQLRCLSMGKECHDSVIVVNSGNTLDMYALCMYITIEMKRLHFIKMLERNGWWLDREGARHSYYTNGEHHESIPRHSEIDEVLAKKIIKRRGLK